MMRFHYFMPKPYGGLDYPYEIPGAILFDDLEVAKQQLAKMNKDAESNGSETRYILFAMQLPNGQLERDASRERVDPSQVFVDEIKPDRKVLLGLLGCIPILRPPARPGI